METPRSLASADFSKVRAVFTDVDGTLTSPHRLHGSTLTSMEQLAEAGIKVVLVSGRSAGWAECWLRQLPVEGVIAENGGVYWAKNAQGRLHKVFAEKRARQLANRRRLKKLVAQAMKQVPGTRLSHDSTYTEVDLAIDFNEEARLGPAAADKIEAWLQARGVKAVRSSVHINCWLGDFNKATMVQTFMRREWGLEWRQPDARFVYVGDSFNDAPMFAAFSLSVGVANVRNVWNQLEARPKFVTWAPYGKGFEELARAVRRAQ
ncbi:MAG: HAD-IIB family hydrolase [Myxococcaceae bacterium]|nr:HAD-IIB family hydrolase [Myxococcaceae bacterium]